MKLDIIYENDHFIAINKPAGLLSIPDRFGKDISLKSLLQDKFGKIFTVHRLDRDTSGLIVFAKDEDTHKFLSQAFEGRDVEKYYFGFVLNVLAEKKGTVNAPIAEHPSRAGQMIVSSKGKPSVTDYEMVEEFGRYSLVKFRIYTGRTHQIRVHMKNVGNPIACDELYGDGQPIFLSSVKKHYKLSKNELEERPLVNRLALHSHRLVFTDAEGIRHDLEAALPKDMHALLQQLRKK